jgi:hypothetical protein
MIGKVIGFIIVIVLFLGILYSVGNNQENGQEQGRQQQGGQEEEQQQGGQEQQQGGQEQQQGGQEEEQEQGGQEEEQEQGGQEEEQEQGGQEEEQEQGGQEQGSQQQGSQEHTESETGSQTVGEANLHNIDKSTNDGPFVRLNGIVENIGNKDAKNYVLQITVNTQEGRYLAQRSFNLGDIAVGEKQEYDDVINLGFQPGPLDYDFHETYD